MVLEEAFRNELEGILDDTINRRPRLGNMMPKFVWDYDKIDFGFKYGQKTGWLLGVFSGLYVGRYKIKPPEDDLLEMVEMIQLRRDEIKLSIQTEDT